MKITFDIEKIRHSENPDLEKEIETLSIKARNTKIDGHLVNNLVQFDFGGDLHEK